VGEGNSRVRLGVIGVIVMALFSGLFARLWFLQIASSESFAAETKANRLRVITEPAVRGSILDVKGRVIVRNELVDSIQVRRGLLDEDRKVMVPRLAKVLGVSERFINRRLDSVRYSPYQPVPIIDQVPYEKLVYIKERPELFPKVDVVRRSIRVYPAFEGTEPVASHLLGYVGAINAKEQKLHKKDGYGPEDVIGKEGIEQVFETELRGSPRVRKLEVDSRGRLVRVLSDKPAVAGNDVQLTMDLEIQRVAEESLAQGMRKASGLKDPGVRTKFQTYKATGGAAVVLDARDGSVVALASAPTFDITKFTDGIPVEDFREYTNPENSYPLLNRAIQGQYAPASTWKLFTSIAALETGVVTPDEVINDRGSVRFEEREFFNASKEPHGNVTLPTALAVSSDVYYYIMGFRFWHQFNNDNKEKPGSGEKGVGYAIQKVAERFGFGKDTNIGLGSELSGRIPTEAFKERLNKDDSDPATRDWLPGDSANFSVGQGDLLVTPMQMATAWAAFANGGTLYAPRLASQVLTPASETILRELPPQETGKTGVKREVRDHIMPGLIGATSPGGIGTAGRAFSGYGGPYEVAGKTGTAEVNGKQDTSVFCAIVNPNPPPDSDEPQYVVVVFVEEGGNGGSVAAPIARRIIEAINGEAEPPEVRVVPPDDD
jgi:penicillin-binding protein 2